MQEKIFSGTPHLRLLRSIPIQTLPRPFPISAKGKASQTGETGFFFFKMIKICIDRLFFLIIITEKSYQ